MLETVVKAGVADDHPFVRQGIRRTLERIPNIVVVGEAENGQEAIELVEEFAPDLLILDNQMPVLDRFQVLEILNRMEVDVHIIVFSGISDPYFKEELLAMGASDFLSKEDGSHLTEVIQKIINTHFI